MLLLKLRTDLLNLVQKIKSILKIQTKYRLNFHEVGYTWGWATGKSKFQTMINQINSKNDKPNHFILLLTKYLSP